MFLPSPHSASRLIPLGLLVLGAAPLRAQTPTWTQQAPIPTGGNAYAVQMTSPGEIWAAGGPLLGGFGILMHTTDAGQHWTTTPFNTTALWAVFFTDAQHGWTAGNGFYHTINGGQSWVQDNDWGSIYDLWFLDDQHGWAAGNGAVAYRTTDGGAHWSAVATPGGSTMSSIFFVDTLNGWCVDIDGQILKSTDGGQSWTINADFSGAYLSTIQFFDALEGWAIGGDTFLHTINGGQSWTPASVPPGTWSHGARFADRLHGIAVGEDGNIVRTVDGGQSWITVKPMGSGPRLWDVEFEGTHAVYSGEGGSLAASSDSGQSWNPIQSGGTGATHGLDVLDALHAWAANDGGEVLSTTNGGAQWVRKSVTGFDVFGNILDVDFLDASFGWAVGTNDFFGGSDGRISRSTDGGLHWQLRLSAPLAEYSGVAALDPQTAIVVDAFPSTSGGGILRTTNGGQSWSPVAPGGGFRGVFFLDASTGWVAGSGIYKSIDGGQHWTPQYGGSVALASVSFADALNGWASGYANTILHTTNGGQSWTPQTASAPPLTAFTGVHAVSPTTAWITGWNGFAARTTDGGQSWIPEPISGAGGAYFECCKFLDADNGWVAGDLGIWNRSLTASCPSPIAYCTAKVNSQGGSAATGWSGTPSLSSADFVLRVTSAVPSKPGLFFFSTTSSATLPFYGGTLCAQPPVVRYPVLTLDALGAGVQAVTISPDMVGTTRWHQFWYRDPLQGDGTGVGLSNALAVTFCN